MAVVFADVLLADGWSWLPPTLNILIIILGIFMILLVLIQRGKGGGLAGAFGGVGGSSAFGSRAGDTFTRVTIITAAVWVLLIMIMAKAIQPQRSTADAASRPSPAVPVEPESDL